jgi:cytidylate kinase
VTIITISRQYGSGGTEIAELVCRQLGYKLVDKQIIAKELALALKRPIASPYAMTKKRPLTCRKFSTSK